MIYETIASFGDIYDKVYKQMFNLFERYYESDFSRYNGSFPEKIQQMRSSYTSKEFVNLFAGFSFASFVDEIKEKIRGETLMDKLVEIVMGKYYFVWGLESQKTKPLLDFLSFAFLGYDFKDWVRVKELTVDFWWDYYDSRKKSLTYKAAKRFAYVLTDIREILLFFEIIPIKDLRKIVYGFEKYYKRNKF
ncbi:MAG: hypothetical protein RMJ17_02555, partial [Candidatus Aenigmarchaeota archaeon]|nr:hypothetical protein [Candidatus Aenigmarchaeota archaeon]MDW8149453.1 hypothetical protein [Candidatus Aenigmarchaeota archaeon]